MGCIFNFLPWLQEHWAHSRKFCFRLREGWFSVQLRWNGWFYIALTVRTQRKRERLWFTVALLPCQSIRPPSATLYSKTLKLKHTLPATGRLEVCVCVCVMDTGLAYPGRCILWVFSILLFLSQTRRLREDSPCFMLVQDKWLVL